MDPIAARRAKRLQRAGRPGFLVGGIIAGVVQVAAALCLGLGIAAMVGDLRIGVINSIFVDSDPGAEGLLGLASIPVFFMGGLIGVLAAAGTGHYLMQVYSGGEKQPARYSVVALWAAAAGLFLGGLTWSAPLTVGTRTDPVFQHDKPWGAGSWLMYRADIWLPAIGIVIAVAGTLYAIKYNRRLRLQLATRKRLLTEGRKVTGEITNVAVRTSQNDQGNRSVVGAEVIVKFTDLQGTDRWVTRQAQGRSAIPTVETAVVLFDPLHPEVDDSIFVTFVSDPLPGDWIGTIV
ncbi:hypothetical protein OG474_39075 [Kribbella sp. NBC_01505]|uniref:hypothetical protein n=1 Tax=Kribbella sp. NBC_01505 TaxID=2903580 RepID=UPI00386494FC